MATFLREGPNADLDQSNKLLRKAKKVAAAEMATKHSAQRIENVRMSNFRCSNEGCAYVLSTDLPEDGRKKGQMKVSAN